MGCAGAVLLAACAAGLAHQPSGTVSPGSGNSPSERAVEQAAIPADWTPDQPLVGHERVCQNGKAGIFDCSNVSLLAFIPARMLGDAGVPVSQRNRDMYDTNTAWGFTDLWGWTDPKSGRQFVLAARAGGTAFLEVTDPLNPSYLGSLPHSATAVPSRWRDIKVYQHYAFIVSDVSESHGLQVFDLNQLLAKRTVPAAFQETARYDRFASAHNLAIDTTSGFAYVVGASASGSEPDNAGPTCGGGLHIVDIRDPLHPAYVNCHPELFGGRRTGGYIHDAQCITYHGPDARYTGRQLCFEAAGGDQGGLGIVDVTDKMQPKLVGIGDYPNQAYAHQGWLSEDQRYFFLGDEADEGESRRSSAPRNTRTLVFDLKTLDDPVLATEFYGTTQATDHNLYVRGAYVYESNYKAGLHILDARDPAHPREVAYFDVAPTLENTSGFGGTWSNYPYFRDGVVAVTAYKLDSGNGIFLLRYRPRAGR